MALTTPTHSSKHGHIDIALLDGTPEDLRKIAEHQKVERIKRVYESQLKMSARFGQVPPPVPPAIAHLYPDVVEAQKSCR
jgi:cation-transporting ATPase 13A1